ncbi:MAG: peptidoglycan-binding domain-containing protein [Cyanobacteriota bacterium]|nr:peptidoglycan-binding domain-containing protein [Cyanobacteriota bacterium]
MSDPTALLLLAYTICSSEQTADRVVPALARYSEQPASSQSQHPRTSSEPCISAPETIAAVPETLSKPQVQSSQSADSLQKVFTHLPLPDVPTPPTLQLGSVGPSVENLQTQLKNLNYYRGNIDGQYGPLTRGAVFQFQRDRGISKTGIANSLTWTELGKTPASSARAARSQTFIAPPKPAPAPVKQPQLAQPRTERQSQLASLLGVVALLCGGMGTFVLFKLAQEQSQWRAYCAEIEEGDGDSV